MDEKPETLIERRNILFSDNIDAAAFDLIRRGRPIPFSLLLYLGIRAILFDPVRWLIKNYPGGIGLKIREIYYRKKMAHLGQNSIIDEGVVVHGARNISIGDYSWIDRNSELRALTGKITIGTRVYVSPGVLVAGGGGVVIGDYVGISRDVKIYSVTHTFIGTKRMSGPMVLEEDQNLFTAPVTIEKDAFIGSNAVILPGVVIGEGAVVGANAVVSKSVPPWTVAVGIPARNVSIRKKVTVKDYL